LSTHLYALPSSLLRLDVEKPKWRQKHGCYHRALRPEVPRRRRQRLLRVGGRNEAEAVESLSAASRVLRRQPLQRLKRLSLLHQVSISPTRFHGNCFKKLDCFSILRNGQAFLIQSSEQLIGKIIYRTIYVDFWCSLLEVKKNLAPLDLEEKWL